MPGIVPHKHFCFWQSSGNSFAFDDMRKSKTLAKIRAGKTVKVCNLGHYVPYFVCLAARAGYDCIWLDLEHRAMGKTEVQALLAYCRIYDIDCMLRPPTREKVGIYRYLEDGATGLMIPHVNTPEDAEALAMAAKFPPIGDRGLDNAGFDSDFRINPNNAEYGEWANQETFLTLQIETPQAVENCEEILGINGVDMLFVGPGDLGFRLDQTGDEDGSQLEAAHERVAAVAKKIGKPWGCPASGSENIQHRIAQGAQFLANMGEFFAINQGLENGVAEFPE